LNIDNLPQIANGLKVQKIPAVFLVHKGNIIDTFVGIPSQKVLEEFVNTALAVDSLSHDENVMKDLMKRIEEYLETNQLELAEKLLFEGVSYETWRDKFGPQLYVGIAYCQLF
jgi:thioredoxin-like negative regulator of GroEL